MFYENYEKLCQKTGKKPYSVAREIGLGNSNVAQWKKGSTPRPDILQKLADYFGVSQAVLLGLDGDQKEKSPAPLGAELTEMQKTAMEFIQKMDEKTLERFISAAKAMLGEK